MYPSTDPKAHPDKLAFPFSKTSAAFSQTLCRPEYLTIKSFPAPVQQLIEAYQPYHSTYPHRDAPLLSQLHELSNADKHRRLNVVAGCSAGIETRGFNLMGVGDVSAGLGAGHVIRDGLVFSWGVVPPQGISPDACAIFSPLAIVFDEGLSLTGWPVDTFLKHVYMLINDQIVGAIRPYFKPGKWD